MDHCRVVSITTAGAFFSSGPYPPANISDASIVVSDSIYFIGGNVSIHFSREMSGVCPVAKCTDTDEFVSLCSEAISNENMH